ncbi:MAG TPA: TonB-dependent receptor [Povalibacter sp.]|nr:TonB-dependent receptor [Povalibacter sp.]
MQNETKARRMVVAIAVTAALSGVSLCAVAGTEGLLAHRDFRIPEQPLDTALLEFSEQARVQLLMWGGAQSGTRSQGVQGYLQAQTALKSVLDRTGYSFEQVDDDVVAIVQAASTQNAAARGSGQRVRLAQSTPQSVTTAGDESARGSEELTTVTVTGSRIVRDGYEAPTPVSVLGAEQLEAMAVTNIADAVNRLPALAGSLTPRNNSSQVSGGTAGINLLNLRALGATRTLVLLDGKRIVGSTLSGGVDVNGIPNELISRVDVVTGGASAVYGSDALSGVVNFVLDKEYTGIKASLEGGMTSRGDNEQYLATLTAGMPFAGGRGHFLFSGEYGYDDGVLEGKSMGSPRRWAETPYLVMNNPDYTPTNGQPELITAFNSAPNNATYGGLIVSCPAAPGGPSTTACPLRGIQFLEGGMPTTFNFGDIGGSLMRGGDWQLANIQQVPPLALEMQRQSGFSRVSFDVTDTTTLFAEVSLARARSINASAAPIFNLGTINVLSGNPFIPEPVQALMTANDIPSFTMGSYNGDAPLLGADNMRQLTRYVAGAEGTFNAGTTWNWDAYYSYSESDITLKATGNQVTANHRRAVDAVLDPSRGQIVCRVNADADPSNDDPACIPYNPMGTGVNSAAAIDYVTETGWANIILDQEVLAASARGEPFSTWAAPVSVAFGVEHRRESVGGRASELDEMNGFFAGNYHASHGKYNVTEGFIETLVPLAKDLPMAQSLDFNGAVRYTDYSTSGEVVTWKAGLTYRPIEDVMFRFTRSRDIRAPNLGDLFNAGAAGTSNMFDPFTNSSRQVISVVSGNPNLQPEEADTTGLGIVLTPSFLPGFAMSVDYYDIKIKDAISSLPSQQYVTRCYEGQSALCGFIHRDADGFIELVNVQPANILAQNASGFDVEMSYRFALSGLVSSWRGDLSLRAMATIVDTLETIDTTTVIDGAGQIGGFGILGGNLHTPDLRYIGMATYSYGPASATLTMRGTGSVVYNNAFVECTSSCPASTATNPTIDNNHVDSVAYYDLALNYKYLEDRAEFFVVVENLMDKDPPAIAGPRGDGFYSGQANVNYDRLGRTYRAGVRLKF